MKLLSRLDFLPNNLIKVYIDAPILLSSIPDVVTDLTTLGIEVDYKPAHSFLVEPGPNGSRILTFKRV